MLWQNPAVELTNITGRVIRIPHTRLKHVSHITVLSLVQDEAGMLHWLVSPNSVLIWSKLTGDEEIAARLRVVSPLQRAVKLKHAGVVRMLLEKSITRGDAEEHKFMATELKWAARGTHWYQDGKYGDSRSGYTQETALVSALLLYPYYSVSDLSSALESAIENNHREVAQLLAQKGAKASLRHYDAKKKLESSKGCKLLASLWRSGVEMDIDATTLEKILEDYPEEE